MSGERILVAGAGAIGSFFGAQLAAAGRDVTFLVRPARRAAFACGLSIASASVPVELAQPRTITATDLGSEPPFGLILLACKAFDLDATASDIEPAVEAGALVLPLLNGVRQLDVLDERFGADAVLGGSCFLSVHRTDEATVRHDGQKARLTFGARGPVRRPVEAVEALLTCPGFAVHRAPDVVAEMWAKWVFIAAAAGATGLVGGTVGELVDADGAWIGARLLAEAAAIAAGHGYPQDETALSSSRRTITEPGSTLVPSLLADVRSGNRTEAEHILGDLVARRGDPTPGLLDAVLVRLRVYDATRPSS
ncbi:ketopantoate reductase family protein [Actinomycetospora termitidis]|uniref:2-dehydropantoate 2-reductase n=1 Tax=Actinomycetospora termitidis TaxID=3053470 RepID=A0ABT7MKS7_9PSEU|nr:2-dehydropantoate 2-reductase [Actinomycetospora sp. Odt1-22]MDL5160517.1 2-dehydropantoate 2-reductase [Actinomycetospora sp. Odt1-22]